MPTERNRYYSAPPQTHNVASQYIWDASIIMTGANGILTGAWRALENTDFGSEITLSGVNVNLNELESINTSGTQYLAYLSGVSAGSSTVTENRSGVLGGTGFYSGLLFTANPNRKEVFVQNVSTVTPSYIRFGSQASTQFFSAVLNPAGTSGQGGGSLSNETFKGNIYFSGGAVTAFEV